MDSLTANLDDLVPVLLVVLILAGAVAAGSAPDTIRERVTARRARRAEVDAALVELDRELDGYTVANYGARR